jgi:hypothetical protein
LRGVGAKNARIGFGTASNELKKEIMEKIKTKIVKTCKQK